MSDLERFIDVLDLTLPVLYDPGGTVNALYWDQSQVGPAPYPQQWLIDKEGTIVYTSRSFDASAVIAAIENELARN